MKDFYHSYYDRITDKRWNSPYPLRRYVHRTNYRQIVDHVWRLAPENGVILDAGCGDGRLSYILARALEKRNVTIFGVDISTPNIFAAYEYCHNTSQTNLHYHIGDAENMSYESESFDVVVSSHVLEHLPDIKAGIRELHRVTKRYVLIAMPTCLNPAAIVQLGGDVFWRLSRRSLYAFWIGLAKLIISIGTEGVNEGYAGDKNNIHIWRYPWVMRRLIRTEGFDVVKFEAQTLCIPYFGSLFPRFGLAVQKKLDSLRALPFFREMGYGSIAILKKR